jgi:hypothetical protein
MMKRTIVLGTLFTTMMALGMSSTDTQRCCYMTCVEANMMMVPPQPADGLPLLFSKKQDRDGKPPRMRPDRLGPNGEQSRERRASFGVDSPIPPQMLEHVMAVATEIDPELASQLSAICAADPAAFDKIIRRQGRRFGSLVRLRERDPELFEVKVAELKLDAEIYFVTESLMGNDVNDPTVQAQLMQLRGLVRVKTALSIRAQTLYIERLERHLDGLRTRLQETTSRFDEIVNDRVESLLKESREYQDCCQHPHHLECVVNTASASPGSCQDPHHLECAAFKRAIQPPLKD